MSAVQASRGGSRHRAVGDLQCRIDDRQPLTQLLLGDNEWRVDEKRVPAHKRKDATLAKVRVEGGHRAELVSPGIEWRQRLARLPILDQLHYAEEADGAYL